MRHTKTGFAAPHHQGPGIYGGRAVNRRTMPAAAGSAAWT